MPYLHKSSVKSFVYFYTFTTISFLLLCTFSYSCAQNYFIDFSGSGSASTVDSVRVENLTQCTSLILNDNDILQLQVYTGTDTPINNPTPIVVYPNPASGFFYVSIYTTSPDKTDIFLYNISGHLICQNQVSLQYGENNILFSGVPPGMMTIVVRNENFFSYTPVINLQDGGMYNSIAIKNSGDLPSLKIFPWKAGSKNVVPMPYNSGNILKLTGISGNYRTVVMLTPTGNQTVTFPFMSCSDDYGNHYAVVQIGNQWWMAENLNAGTYAQVTYPQVSGTKFCQNYSGQNDPSCPMGGLYLYANIMQGGTPCNGIGPPPNDRCVTPVRGLCPVGWHIPSHHEWTTLERSVSNNPNVFPYDETTISVTGSDEGGHLKEVCTSHWWAPNAGATNRTGFTGLPGGSAWHGVFDDFGQSGYWWSSTEYVASYAAWVRALNYSVSTTGRSGYFEESGFNVRCVKD